jgi:hypothetical protein
MEISKALICDAQLQAMFNELSSVKSEMDKAQLNPSASTVLNILSYSKNLQKKSL